MVSLDFPHFKQVFANPSHTVTTTYEGPEMEKHSLPRKNVSYVLGADGNPLTPSDLPASNTRRWVSSRKAQVVVAVQSGLLSLEEACNRYSLTVEEFLAWQAAIQSFGLPALRTTRIQHYRRTGITGRSTNG